MIIATSTDGSIIYYTFDRQISFSPLQSFLFTEKYREVYVSLNIFGSL